MKLISNRAGKLITHQTQYQFFIPTSLSDVEINIDFDILKLLTEASLCLGRLDELGYKLPDKDLFIAMYVQKEAVISSQIEGTQVSLDDVLQLNVAKKKDINEIVNYIKALNKGLELLDSLPICSRFFKQIHKILVSDTRGCQKNPGEFRISQNWIGPKDCTLLNASFIPPSPETLNNCLSNLEKYINSNNKKYPILIDAALIHYQFETIHPFLDGNGRVGRILIPLLLINNKLINYPLIYLSLYFKENRSQYYSLLMDVRTKGNYEEWIKFFLKGLISVTKDSIETIEKILKLKNECINLLDKHLPKANGNYKKAIEFIFSHPYFTSSEMRENLNLSKPTINTIINTFISLDIVIKKDNKQRNSTYCFSKYINILKPGTEI